MIRFILAAFLLHFSMFSLISCTTTEENSSDVSQAIDEAAATNGPTDENEAAALTDVNSDKAPGEEALESELDKEDPSAGKNKAAKENASSPLAEDSLEQELAENNTPPASPPAADALAPKASTGSDLSAASEAPPAPAPTPVENEKARVRDIRYLSNANGGTVVIETSKPVIYKSRLNSATQQFIVEMADVELPAALQRPYVLKEFGTKFGSINAYQGSGSSTARVVIQLAGNAGEPILQQEGNSLVVVPAATPVNVAASAPASEVAAPGTAAAAESAKNREGALAAKSLDEFLSGNQKFYGRAISLQVKDADIRDVINFLAEESGANIVMSDDVTGKISLKLRKTPWDQALVTVMRSRALGYVRQGNVLRISTLKALDTETELSNKIIQAQKTIAPAVVQVIPISYSNMDDLMTSVRAFLSKDGKVVADKRSNTLIVTDIGDVVDRVVKLVRTLDVPPSQVSIESKIVEAVEGFENFAGITWGATGSPIHLSPGGGADGAPIDMLGGISSNPLSQQITSALPFQTHLNVGTLDIFGDLTATLALAEHDSLAKVISAPRISTINREKSTIIQQGENVAIVSTAAPNSTLISKSEKRTPFSLELSVTPQITSDGGVIMDLDVKREFLGPVVDTELQSRAVNTRKATTKVLVRNGQTAVIGGIYSSDEEEQTNGVPGLMNLPVVGWLFKNRSVTRTKNELLIFMTPRIIAADGLAPKD